jgi:hypothetical protein
MHEGEENARRKRNLMECVSETRDRNRDRDRALERQIARIGAKETTKVFLGGLKEGIVVTFQQ